MSAPDLAAYLTDASVPDDAPAPDATDDERGRYRITNDGAAGWALKKLALAHAEIDRVTDQAQAEYDRIARYVADATAGPKHEIAFFEGLLREYHEGLLDEEIDRLMGEGKPYAEAWQKAKRKTYRLPAGELVARKGGTGYDTEDTEAFDRWVRENPVERLRFAKVSPAKAEITEATQSTEAGTLVLDDGEYVPGVRFYENPPSFAAKPAPLPGRGAQ